MCPLCPIIYVPGGREASLEDLFTQRCKASTNYNRGRRSRLEWTPSIECVLYRLGLTYPSRNMRIIVFTWKQCFTVFFISRNMRIIVFTWKLLVAKIIGLYIYICIYIYIYICTHTHTYIHTYIHTYMYVYICTCIIYICIYMYMYIYTCTCIFATIIGLYIYVYICIYVYMYVCVTAWLIYRMCSPCTCTWVWLPTATASSGTAEVISRPLFLIFSKNTYSGLHTTVPSQVMYKKMYSDTPLSIRV